MNAPRPSALLVLALVLALAAPRAAACELDGLSHGYGPMGAVFAGAHRYQALNGLADEAEERADIAPVVEPVAKPATPRRSFARWATRKTASAAAGEAPAPWVPAPEASAATSKAPADAGPLTDQAPARR